MPNVTLATLRERVCREAGLWKEYITTSDGSTGLETLISTRFADWEDGSLGNKHVLITGSTSTGLVGEWRKIQGNESPLGIIHPYRNFSAQVPTTSTVELMDFEPDGIHNFINQTIRDAYPALSKQIVDTTLISGNILPNSSFEIWTLTANPDYWTVDTAKVEEETSTVLFGSSSVKLSTAAGKLYLTSDSFLPLMDLAGTSADVYGWVNCSTANCARLALKTTDIEGTSVTTYSEYHTGDGEWELLNIESAPIPASTKPSAVTDVAEIQIHLLIDTNNDAYFDSVHLEATIPAAYEYLMPNGMDRVSQVNFCNDADELGVDDWVRGNFKVIDRSGTKWIRTDDLNSGRKLEVIGIGEFDELEDDTDEISLSKEWERAIIFGTVAQLLRTNTGVISSSNVKDLLVRAEWYEREFRKVKDSKFTRTAPYAIRKWV